MDESKNKPHQERLKTDVELKVTDEVEDTDDVNDTAPSAFSRSAKASVIGSENDKSKASRDLRVTVLAERKAREQAFLADYKRKLVRTRIKFIACAAVFLAAFGTMVYFVCSKNEKAAAALTQFQSIPVFAGLGERDMAYYIVSGFTRDGTTTAVEPKLLEPRIKILDRAITEQEKTGHPAIFSRLGAEQMLVRQGQREQALRFGDPLIAKFPDLPSNWFWRAKIDFDHLDFANAVKDYEQAAAIVERLPYEVGESFHDEYIKAVWAAINAGQFDKGMEFAELSAKYRFGDYDKQGLQSQVLLAESSALAVADLQNSDLWNEQIEHYNQRLLSQAKQQATAMEFVKNSNHLAVTDASKQELLFEIALRSGQLNEAADIVAATFTSRNQSRRRATLMLAQNRPQDALTELAPQRQRTMYRATNLEILAAEALIKLHRPEEALAVINEMLDTYHSPEGVSTAKLYLPFRVLKARALQEFGKYPGAIAESEAILSINPNLIAPRLVKLDALKKLGQANLAAKEHEATSALLKGVVDNKDQFETVKRTNEELTTTEPRARQ